MPVPHSDEYLPLWYNALDEEIGYLYQTDDRKSLVQKLYDARKRSGDETLDALIVLQVKDDIIYIAKKAVELPE